MLAFGPTLDYSVVLLLAVLGASACAWLGSIYLLKPPVYKEIDPIMRRLNDVVFHR